MPFLKEDEQEESFQLGKGRVITQGEDVLIVACGETVYPAVEAARRLAAEGISTTVISMHTIKPLDTDLLKRAACDCKVVVTVEEHSVNGGLGEACAAYFMQHRIFKPLTIMGIPDEYTVTGSQAEIFDHYGINKTGIADNARALLKAEPALKRG